MNKYLNYASYYASYLLDELKEFNFISSIILFGSAARNEANKESDIDIFVEISKVNKKYESMIKEITDKFYGSREALLFKNKGIDNKINIIIGKISDWNDLRGGIENHGVILYGHYISSKTKGKKHLIISWDGIKKNRGAFLNKIYGFKSKNKKYKGVLEEINGIKIGKSSIMIPIDKKSEIYDLIKKYEANAKIIEVYL